MSFASKFDLLVDPNDLTEANLKSIEDKYIVFYEKYKDYTFMERNEQNDYYLSKLIDPKIYDLNVIFHIYDGKFNMRVQRKGTDAVASVISFLNISPLKQLTIDDFVIANTKTGSLVTKDSYANNPTKFIDNQALDDFLLLFGKTPPTNSGGSSRRKTMRRKTMIRKTMRRNTKKTKRKSRH
jgi:hypothetical protein